MSERPSFSLLEEGWLPCLMLDGTTAELSLTQVFERANEIRAIDCELAVMDFALLRLLLAVLHGAFGKDLTDSESWQELREEGLGSPRIVGYLREHAERFDLLHPATPFFQVAGLHTAKHEFSGLEKLILDVPNGEPFMTTRGGNGLRRIGFAEAARWVVTAQAFDISGIKSGAVGDERVKGGKGYPIGTGWAGSVGGVYVEGASLAETLWLNLVGPTAVPGLDWSSDVPAWERPAPTAAEDPTARVTGPASLYTWQSRRILLEHDGAAVTGVLVANGDRIPLHNQHVFEPLTRWRRSEPQQKKLGLEVVYMPRAHSPERALWRGVAGVLPLGESRGKAAEESFLPSLGAQWLAQLRLDGVLPASHPVRLRAVGLVYGPQDSSAADQIDDALLVELATLANTDPQLRRDVELATQATDDAVQAVRNLARNIAEAENRDSEGPVRLAAGTAYAALEPVFRDWLLHLGTDDTTTALTDWKRRAIEVVSRCADELVASASATAWTGREAKGRYVSTPLAEVWFRSAMNKALRAPLRPTEDKEVAA